MDLNQAGRMVFDAITDCGDHPIDLAFDEIDTTIAARQWCDCETRGDNPCRSYCDSNGAALYALKDGRFAAATEWSDTSGHG